MTAVLFWRIYGQKGGMLITAVILALSPLTVQFSSTAFTDPLLTFWLVASLASMQVASGQVSIRQVASNKLQVTSSPHHPITLLPYHPLTAGFLFGLAVATKYQAWLFLPLVLGMGWLGGYGRRDWLRWLGGLLPVLTVMFLWELARKGSFTLWSAQVSNYGGVRLAWSWELWPRLQAWVGLWLTAVPGLLMFLFLVLTLGLLARAWGVDDIDGRYDGLFVLFVLGYWLLHWLLAVPVWDRYLLPVVPLVAVILARGIWVLGYWVIRIFNISIPQYRYLQTLITISCVAILLISAWGARYGRYPVGGQVQADDGAGQIAAYLQEAPYGTVLYDHWYSWQWRYHLFDTGVYVSWFPYGAALVEELLVFGDDGNAHYVALPDTAVSQPIIRSLTEAGFQLQPVVNKGNIILYQIFPTEVFGEETT
jgi:hypothetical protein